ncbi:hypothetical protein ACFS27_03370 [Promicromonospora vindobonensis]|uniref:Head-to-tail stopper n=1 Tax=Promicromonospora vindobonensis TaxID=195748 RepID=A0ABW5VRE9_9MICO
MSDVWDDWEDQTVTVKPYLGAGGNGPVYGASYPLACLIDATVRLVRNPQAVEVVSSTTLHASAADAPPGSIVTLPDGRTSKVIIVGTPTAVDDPDLTGVEISLE